MSTSPLALSAHPSGIRPAGDRATSLELFFDLVYVFAFTQVTHLMAAGGSLPSVLGGIAVLGVLWWSWASHAWLANQNIADRGVVRTGIFAAIAIVLVLAIAIPEVYPVRAKATSERWFLRAVSFCSRSSTRSSTSQSRNATCHFAARSSGP